MNGYNNSFVHDTIPLETQPAPFYRRLGAILYDLILILALFMISTTCLLLLFNKGNAIPIGNLYYQEFLLFLFCAYHLWFWVKSGQTTGMAAWHIQLVSKVNHRPISLKQACLRFLVAIPLLLLGGVGLFYCLFNKKRSSLYDKIAGTECIILRRPLFKHNA